MINPVILSDTNESEAKGKFENWLAEEPVTTLLILGKHDIALHYLN